MSARYVKRMTDQERQQVLRMIEEENLLDIQDASCGVGGIECWSLLRRPGGFGRGGEWGIKIDFIDWDGSYMENFSFADLVRCKCGCILAVTDAEADEFCPHCDRSIYES